MGMGMEGITGAALPDLADAVAWIGATTPARLMRSHPWLYPAVETVHILGFVLLVGAAAMFDLRVLGCGRQLPLRELARHLLPWSAASLLLVMPSGVLLFSSQPADMLANPVFLLKMGLVAAAGLNALAYHRSPWWRAAGPPGRAGRPRAGPGRVVAAAAGRRDRLRQDAGVCLISPARYRAPSSARTRTPAPRWPRCRCRFPVIPAPRR